MDREARKRLMEQMRGAVDRIQAGETEPEIVDVGEAGSIRMTPDPDSPMGARIEALGDEVAAGLQMLAFPAAASCPEGYPETLPFLPDCGVMITEFPDRGRWMAVWMLVPDAASSFQAAVEWHRTADWEERDGEGLDTAEVTERLRAKGMDEDGIAKGMAMFGSMQVASFVTDGRERSISLVGMPDARGSIHLIEKPADDPD